MHDERRFQAGLNSLHFLDFDSVLKPLQLSQRHVERFADRHLALQFAVARGIYVGERRSDGHKRLRVGDAARGPENAKEFVAFPPETIAQENAIDNGKVISSLQDYAAIPLRGNNVPAGAVETRALVLTFALMPGIGPPFAVFMPSIELR